MLGVLACSDPHGASPDASDCPTGVCVAEDNVVYAAPTGSDTTSCTKADPCSITRAFTIAVPPRDTIKLEPGSYTASIDVNVASGMIITVQGFGATWNAPAGAHSLALTLSNGGLRVEGVSFGGSVTCQGDSVRRYAFELDRVSIDAEDVPLSIYRCATSIARSSIRSHGTRTSISIAYFWPVSIDRTLITGGGGIAAAGTPVQITNSVIANQTGSALRASNIAELSVGQICVKFTTIINSMVSCSLSTGFIGVHNSIVLNQVSGAPADTISSGSRCTVSYTTVFPQGTRFPGDHNKLDVDPLLKDPANGDYHLTPASPAVDAAGETGTPDFDGTARPQGAQSDMGAFELVP